MKDKIKKIEKNDSKKVIPVIFALIMVVCSVGYIIARTMSNKAYNEKWKDYNDCGLV